MCLFKAPKAPAPAKMPTAPTATPEIIDDNAVAARDRDRDRQRRMYGRQSTILAGAAPTAGAPATASAKTAMGQ